MSLFIRNLLAASRGEDSSFTLQLVADRIKELELVERRESVQVSETHLDWAVCPVGLSAADASLYYSALLRGELKFEADTHIQELNGNHFFVQSFKLNERLLDDTDFFLHWGKDGAPWISQEVRPVDIAPRPEGGYFIRAKILAHEPGQYRATIYAKHAHSSELLWIGRPQLDDQPFEVSAKSNLIPITVAIKQRAEVGSSIQELLEIIDSYDRFASELIRKKRSADFKILGREVFKRTSQNAVLREKLSEHLARAKEIVASSRDAKERRLAQEVIQLLQRLGIGEVVLVAPEGPHATAGGLSQVITGLLHTLSDRDIHSTLISVLYEEPNGKKHPSAEQILSNGFFFDGEILKPKLVGEVTVQFGETRNANGVVRYPQIIPVSVYLAQKDNVRILLVRHRRLADSLYRNVWADEQVRRSVFLSRAALEIMSNPEFGITPHLVISNDWMTGLVPALMQIDERYYNNPALREAQTCHIIHNGGKGYQGRFATVQFGEDIFPLLGLSGPHLAGLSDPHEKGILNFTAAAVYHVRNAVLTVSQPYAEQLLTPEGGDGLESLFRRRRRILFGISNGIDRLAIRKTIWELAFLAIGEEAKAYRYRDALWSRRLPAMKKELKNGIQRRFNLQVDSEAPLICLVGRLTEQKGIGLIVGEVAPKVSMLDALLRENPRLQVLICGPLSEGDPLSLHLKRHLEELKLWYPGRVSASLEFAPHKEALEIAAASDLFLMPSRYEPGGLTQLEALAVGTPVVARNVGGLQATLRDALNDLEQGNAFLFNDYTPKEFLRVINKALRLYERPEEFRKLEINASEAKHDWTDRLPSYLALFRFIAGVSEPFRRYSFLEDEVSMVEAIRASRV